MAGEILFICLGVGSIPAVDLDPGEPPDDELTEPSTADQRTDWRSMKSCGRRVARGAHPR